MLTVRETALQAELEKVKRELAFYKDRERYNAQPITETFLDDTITGVQVKDDALVFKTIGTWNVRKSPMGGYHLLGRTEGPGDNFSLNYMVTEPHLYLANDRLSILGALHEKVIRQLAAQVR